MTATSDEILVKRKLIRQHAAGRTYVDIGGLWGTKGETVTTAIEGGATHATMVDIQPLGNHSWQAFEKHCAASGVDGYSERQIDICSPDAPQELGTFDFVHCAGLMYHVADLFAFVGNLRSVTTEYLMLSSVVMPDVVANAHGTLEFGADHSYLAPVLSDQNREIVREYLREAGQRAAGLTDDSPFFRGARPLTGPWWWLFSGAFMSRLVSLYDMDVLAEGRTPKGFGYTVFARVKSADAHG